MKNELEILEQKTIDPNFWNDQKESNKILSEIKSRKSKCIKFEELKSSLENIQELTELVKIEPDEELAKEIIIDTRKLEKSFEKFELQTLLSGKYDRGNAILTLHPGAGGTESQDWAEMLYRMYTRWANKNGYEVKELDYLEGD